MAMVAIVAGWEIAARAEPPPIRRFLEQPPRYDALLLHRALSVAPVSFRNRREADEFVRKVRAGQIKPAGQDAFYEIRHQSDPAAFLLRLLDDPDDFERSTGLRGTPFAGRFESNWWSILPVKPAQIQILESADGLDVGRDGVTNSYHHGNERWATEFIRLGLVDVLESTLRWADGDQRFDAVTETGLPCEGRIEAGPAGASARIELRYAGRDSGRFVEIQGTNDGPQWLPLSIQLVDWQGKRTSTNTHARYQALEYRLASNPLPRERFSPEPYLTTNDWWVELKQGEHYVLQTEGTNVVRLRTEDAPRRLDLRPVAKVLLLVVLATMALSTLVIGIGWRRRAGRVPRPQEHVQPTEPRR